MRAFRLSDNNKAHFKIMRCKHCGTEKQCNWCGNNKFVMESTRVFDCEYVNSQLVCRLESDTIRKIYCSECWTDVEISETVVIIKK